MKKCFAIFMLLIYVFCKTDSGEWLKFPLLVEHFAEHKNLNPKISFWDFFCEHYSHDDNIANSDHDKDMKLPFKSFSSHCHSNAFYVFENTKSIVFSSYFFEEIVIKTKFSYQFSFISQFKNNIWQPPKINV
jgi:hypothetical protein